MEQYTHLKEQRQCLRDIIPLEKPFTLLFDPSSICNFKCIQCFHSEDGVEKIMPRGQMDFQQFTKIIDELKMWEGSKIKVIRIIGFGEPFVNKNTAKMVQYIRNADVAERIEITTNGSLITEDVAQQLVEAELDYIRISIYSAIQKRHEEITRNPIDITQIYNNIKRLQEKKRSAGKQRPFVYIKMLDTFNEKENQAFFKMYSSIADEIKIESPHNWLNMSEKTDLYDGKKVCPQPFKMLSIRQNGDVIVCDPDWTNHTKVGNAFEKSLKDIWHGKELREFWKMQIEGRRCENESCQRCTFLNDAYVLDDIDGIGIEKIENW